MERRVDVGACRCPGHPHPNDWVDVIEKVPLTMGAAVIASVRVANGNSTIAEGLMAEACLIFGVADWSMVDENGLPVRIDIENVQRLLPYANGGYDVAERVMALHSEEVLRPLMSRTSSTRSQGGQTDGSTSPTPDDGHKPPRPLRPSSRTSTAGTPSGVPVL